LHAKELCIVKAEYTTDTNDAAVAVEEMIVNIKATTVKFIFATPIAKDTKSLQLKIEYTGFLNNQMAGFYRSSYTDIEGKSQIMASTQFESLDARRAFPCVDEPAVKAIFGLTLTIPRNRDCFSNMPESSISTVSATKKKVSFLDSPKMSTYLLAFCVGEFDHVQTLTQHGVLVKVYTPPGKASSGQFALDAAVRSLDAYDDFFGIPYPLPKLDMVAIPEFAMGAMENWGLVTYREVEVLIDPLTASRSQKQRVATVIAHELAHQWFGNLVTMQWWDDLWLNEGFASWAENWAVDLLYPDYCMWDQFTTGHLCDATRFSQIESSHSSTDSSCRRSGTSL
jgi:aminopeptidase N